MSKSNGNGFGVQLYKVILKVYLLTTNCFGFENSLLNFSIRLCVSTEHRESWWLYSSNQISSPTVALWVIAAVDIMCVTKRRVFRRQALVHSVSHHGLELYLFFMNTTTMISCRCMSYRKLGCGSLCGDFSYHGSKNIHNLRLTYTCGRSVWETFHN